MSKTTTPVDPETTGSPALEYAIVESDRGPQCTIYPAECDPDEIVTHWLTAIEGSFVSVADVR